MLNIKIMNQNIQTKNTNTQTPWDEKYEKLKKLHKIITDSLSAVDKDLNQTRLEWLQFCNLVDKQNEQSSSYSSDPVPEIESGMDLLTNIEDSALINTQPIDVNIKVESTQVKYQVEEFDSD